MLGRQTFFFLICKTGQKSRSVCTEGTGIDSKYDHLHSLYHAQLLVHSDTILLIDYENIKNQFHR